MGVIVKITLMEIDGSPAEIIAVIERLPGWSAADIKVITTQIESGESVCPDDARALSDRLSDREKQVLYYLMEGVSNKAIAAELKIGDQTVKSHIQSILAKIGVQNRTKAALWAQVHLGGTERPKLTLVAASK